MSKIRQCDINRRPHFGRHWFWVSKYSWFSGFLHEPNRLPYQVPYLCTGTFLQHQVSCPHMCVSRHQNYKRLIFLMNIHQYTLFNHKNKHSRINFDLPTKHHSVIRSVRSHTLPRSRYSLQLLQSQEETLKTNKY